jgi:hypothetical protein
MSNLDTLVDELIDAKPDASEFIDQILEQEKAAENVDTSDTASSDAQSNVGGGVAVSNEPIRDDSGANAAETFDPAIHCADEFGNPVVTKTGKLRRRPGRKSAAGFAPQIDLTDKRAGDAAIQVVTLIIIMGHTIGGEEWDAKEDEIVNMQAAWKAYFIDHGIVAFPSWVGVVIATGGYALPRVHKPKTRERLLAFGGWVKSNVARVRRWLHI